MPARCCQVRLMALKEQLMALELDTTESVQELCQEFDQRYSELAEARKTAFNTYFAAVSRGPVAVSSLMQSCQNPVHLPGLCMD